MDELLKKLRSPQMGWSGDAFAVDAETAENAAALIERMKGALDLARSALTADTIGTVNMDDPEWYQQVDKAVAAIDAARS